MKPTEELREEHKGIKLMLRIIEKVCQKLESGEKIDSEHLNQILEFLSIFADRCHHGKEEEKLFPEMERVGIPREDGPIGIMITEHNAGRGYIKNMREAFHTYKTDEREASSKFVENARNYITLLTQHIEKEDNIFFPMADARLSREKQEELSKQFEKVENERIGVGKHEELHKLLGVLKDIYLG